MPPPPPLRRPRAKTKAAASDSLTRIGPQLSRLVERVVATHVPPLTLGQFLVLQSLAAGEVIGAELARRAAVSPAAVSQVLATLETAGLVERARSDDDRRRQPVALTTRGRTVLESARSGVRARLDEPLSALHEHEALELRRALERLDEVLGGTVPPPRPPPPPRSPGPR